MELNNDAGFAQLGVSHDVVRVRQWCSVPGRLRRRAVGQRERDFPLALGDDVRGGVHGASETRQGEAAMAGRQRLRRRLRQRSKTRKRAALVEQRRGTCAKVITETKLPNYRSAKPYSDRAFSHGRVMNPFFPCLLPSCTKGITGRTSDTGRGRTTGRRAQSSREPSSRTLKKVLACSPLQPGKNSRCA